MGDENDIDTGTVHLGMKLTTGMNQEMIFSDLIQDKKIYNFGIKKIEAVTAVFPEEDSLQKIQVTLNGGTLKKKEMTVSLEYLNITSTGTILSDRMMEFPTTSNPSSLQPNHFKITISSKETSSRKWSKPIVPSGDWEKKPTKRNTATIPEPECSIKSAKFDDVQSDLVDFMDEEWRSNPNIFEPDVFLPLIEGERYHSLTASDVAKQSTNNQINEDDKTVITIAEDFKDMRFRLEQKALRQHIDKFPHLDKFHLTIVPKYKYSIKETFMEKFSQLCADQFLPEIIDRRKELSEPENVEKLRPNGEKDVCWRQRSEDDFGSPIIFRHTGIWSKFMANSFFVFVGMHIFIKSFHLQ